MDARNSADASNMNRAEVQSMGTPSPTKKCIFGDFWFYYFCFPRSFPRVIGNSEKLSLTLIQGDTGRSFSVSRHMFMVLDGGHFQPSLFITTVKWSWDFC